MGLFSDKQVRPGEKLLFAGESETTTREWQRLGSPSPRQITARPTRRLVSPNIHVHSSAQWHARPCDYHIRPAQSWGAQVGGGARLSWHGVMVVLARSSGCPSRHEPARSQGFPIPADNFPNELARVCDSVGKSPAWRGLDVAFLSHFVITSLW